MTVTTVNPFRCKMWAMHDRLEDYLDEKSCREEIESVRKHGQLVPVLGRPLTDDPDYDAELIYGARRLFVARHLNVPLKVELRDVPDRLALIAMDIENRQRKDVSSYERVASFARWLRNGYFQSQDDLARALGISPSVVSRLLKVARLPAVIVNAFESPADICETWGIELFDALADRERRDGILREARRIAHLSPRPSAREVYTCLVSASAKGRKVRTRPRDEVVKGDHGKALYRIRYQRDMVAILLPRDRLSPGQLNTIRQVLARVLQGPTVQRVNLNELSPASSPPHGVDVAEGRHEVFPFPLRAGSFGGVPEAKA